MILGEKIYENIQICNHIMYKVHVHILFIIECRFCRARFHNISSSEFVISEKEPLRQSKIHVLHMNMGFFEI